MSILDEIREAVAKVMAADEARQARADELAIYCAPGRLDYVEDMLAAAFPGVRFHVHASPLVEPRRLLVVDRAALDQALWRWGAGP